MEIAHQLAVLSLVFSALCAAWVLGDILLKRKQKMAVMNWVWPISALYGGPLALWAYYAIGRSPARDANGKQAEKPFWQAVLVGTTHCGAGCTLGDIVAEWMVFAAGIRIAGSTLLASFGVDFGMAYLAGILFQYFAIAPMREISGLAGIWAAVKADTVSLIAFEVGMFVFMYASRGFYPVALHPNSPLYWFNMQGAMLVGFATAYPANWWLIRRGWKEQM